MDLGCGSGEVLARVLVQGFRRPVWGVDLEIEPLMPLVKCLSEDSLELAQLMFYKQQDIQTLESLNGIHVAFVFGVAFLPVVVNHVMELFSDSRTLHDVVWISKRNNEEADEFAQMEFSLVSRFKSQMRKGSESFWVELWRKNVGSHTSEPGDDLLRSSQCAADGVGDWLGPPGQAASIFIRVGKDSCFLWFHRATKAIEVRFSTCLCLSECMLAVTVR